MQTRAIRPLEIEDVRRILLDRAHAGTCGWVASGVGAQ